MLERRGFEALYVQEVENALANEDLFAKREKHLEKAVAENERALKKVKAQFKVGRIDLLSALQIQARVLGARSALIAVRNERVKHREHLAHLRKLPIHIRDL